MINDHDDNTNIAPPPHQVGFSNNEGSLVESIMKHEIKKLEESYELGQIEDKEELYRLKKIIKRKYLPQEDLIDYRDEEAERRH